MVTVMVADDHPFVLEGISAILQSSPFEVIGNYGNGDDLLAAVREARPDIVLTDHAMPGRTGLDVLKHIKQELQSAKVIIVTGSIRDTDILAAVKAGADGVLLKSSAKQHLLEALYAVSRNLRWFDPEVTQRVLMTTSEPDLGTKAASKLTAREEAIVKAVAKGLRNKEISRNLEITEGTVKMHLHNIFEKLWVSSRTELAIFVRDHDLGD